MAIEALTNRQLEVYLFIEDKIHNRGYGPTVREICKHFDIKSPNGVVCHLKALEKKGLIRRKPKQSRAIELVDHYRLSEQGAVVVANTEQSKKRTIDSKIFIVKDDSLIAKHVLPGDQVLVTGDAEPVLGDIVAIKESEGEIVLKIIDREDVLATLDKETLVGTANRVIRSLK